MNYEVRIMKEESDQRSAMSDQPLADDRRSADFGLGNQSRERERPVTTGESRITDHESRESSLAEQSHLRPSSWWRWDCG